MGQCKMFWFTKKYFLLKLIFLSTLTSVNSIECSPIELYFNEESKV